MGSIRIAESMDLVFISSVMEISIKENLKMANFKVKAKWNTLMETITAESLSMVLKKEKVSISTTMETSTEDRGRVTPSKVWELISIRAVEILIRACLSRVRRVAMESICILMAMCTWANSEMV